MLVRQKKNLNCYKNVTNEKIKPSDKKVIIMRSKSHLGVLKVVIVRERCFKVFSIHLVTRCVSSRLFCHSYKSKRGLWARELSLNDYL